MRARFAGPVAGRRREAPKSGITQMQLDAAHPLLPIVTLDLPAVAEVSRRRHSWGMPSRRLMETTLDLFSALPAVTAAGPSADPKGKAGPDSLASQQRHFLPEDLAGALKRLDDVEIDALLAAVTAEAERRGRRPPSPARGRQ